MAIAIWTYIFGGATVFALIVGLFSVYNGRMTRRELGALIERGNERTQSLLERMDTRIERTDTRVDRLTEHMERLTEGMDHLTGSMERLTQRMDRLAEHMQQMDRRHIELLTRIVEKIH